MYSIEDVGLVKIDLLGNRCLTEIQETLEWVSGREPSWAQVRERASSSATSPATGDLPGVETGEDRRTPFSHAPSTDAPSPHGAEAASDRAPPGASSSGSSRVVFGESPPASREREHAPSSTTSTVVSNLPPVPRAGSPDSRDSPGGESGLHPSTAPSSTTPLTFPHEAREVGFSATGSSGATPAPRAFALDRIPDHDARTAELLETGQTLGCFQLESPAMRQLLQQLRVRSVRDCIAAVALIRPGPAEGGMKERFIRRARGLEPVDFLHPSLRPVLEENHGIILYEEDVMQVIATLTGRSLAEGDRLRSAIKKCPGPAEAEELENDFVGAAIGNGLPPSLALDGWRALQRFARYSFNKAHASGYGRLAYQSAYLKAHHPVEFTCALLNHHAGMYSKRTLVGEARRIGVRILPPCVNRSARAHRVETRPGTGERAVRLGLSQVKGLAGSSLTRLEAERPFASLNDLIRRCDLPRRELESLILVGALDFTGLRRPQLIWELETTHRSQRGRGELGLLREIDAQDGEAPSPAAPGTPFHPDLPEYTPLYRLVCELRHLDLTVERHPFEVLEGMPALEDRVRARDFIASSGESAIRAGQTVRVAGLVAARRRAPTRNGDTIQFLTLEDETGLVEATMFPRELRRFSHLLGGLGPLVARGQVEENHGSRTLTVQHLEKITVESLSGLDG